MNVSDVKYSTSEKSKKSFWVFAIAILGVITIICTISQQRSINNHQTANKSSIKFAQNKESNNGKMDEGLSQNTDLKNIIANQQQSLKEKHQSLDASYSKRKSPIEDTSNVTRNEKNEQSLAGNQAKSNGELTKSVDTREVMDYEIQQNYSKNIENPLYQEEKIITDSSFDNPSNNVEVTSVSSEDLNSTQIVSTVENDNIQKLEDLEIVRVSSIGSLTSYIDYERSRVYPSMLIEGNSSNLIKILPSSKKWTVEAGMGVALWNQNPKIESDNNGFEHINSVLSNSQTLGLEYNVNKNWSVYTGINRIQLLSKLDAEFVDHTPRTIHNTPTKIVINSFNNTSDTIVGDVVVVDTTIRTIVHYNKNTQFRIPLLARYTYDLGKFDIGIGLGTIVTLSHSVEGRLNNNPEVLEYSNDLNNPYNTNFQMTFLSEARVRYHLNDYIYLGASLGYSPSFANWSTLDGVEIKPQVLNSEIRFGVKF